MADHLVEKTGELGPQYGLRDAHAAHDIGRDHAVCARRLHLADGTLQSGAAQDEEIGVERPRSEGDEHVFRVRGQGADEAPGLLHLRLDEGFIERGVAEDNEFSLLIEMRGDGLLTLDDDVGQRLSGVFSSDGGADAPIPADDVMVFEFI